MAVPAMSTQKRRKCKRRNNWDKVTKLLYSVNFDETTEITHCSHRVSPRDTTKDENRSKAASAE